MKRFSLVAIGLILAGVSALAAPNPNTGKVPPFPGTLANARYVYVASYDGDQFDPNLLAEDRNAIGAVQNAIQQWGKLTIVYRPSEADVTFVIAPHTPRTEGLIGARELALLPDGALLVNVARGKLVDTDALVAELSTGRIRAALDVTDPEPLPADHPLWRQPGALISPHVGGASSAFFPRADRLMAAQLNRFLAGQPLENIVKPG